MNWSDYGSQLLGNILSYTIPAKDKPDPIIYRTEKAHARKRVFLLGMMATSSKSASVYSIEISGENILDMNLRKTIGKDGKLKIFKLSDFELHKVRSVS